VMTRAANASEISDHGATSQCDDGASYAVAPFLNVLSDSCALPPLLDAGQELNGDSRICACVVRC